MKKVSMLVCSVFFVLLASTIAFADFTDIDDEFAIDYQTQKLRIFLVGKDKSIFYSKARDKFISYVETLTIGEDSKKLADVFKARPALQAKVLGIIAKNTTAPFSTISEGYTEVPGMGVSIYYYFDLNTLKPVLPDLNFPTP